MNILSIENAMTWSWGLTVPSYMEYWQHKVGRMIRQPKIDVKYPCSSCGNTIDQTIKPVRINKELTEVFDVVLVQNVDTLPQMDYLKNVACRMGGMVKEGNENRYNKYLKDCGAVISSNSELNFIAGKANDNCFLIPNGVDLVKFHPLPERPERQFTIGFAGNIAGPGMYYKGWKYLVQVEIDLWGKIKFEKRIHSHNQVDHGDMCKEFYHKIDCLVLPSLGEGCSNVTMEALACGVPVLTTKVGYHGERLIDGEDVLFIQRDREDVKEKILMLMKDQNLWQTLSENGREFAEKNHDLKSIAKQYDDVFRTVIERQKYHG